MSKEAAKGLVELLTKELKGNWSQKAMGEVWADLCQQPDKALFAAGDYFCLNSNGFLPSPQKLLDHVKAEAKKIAADESRKREREWAEQKGGETREQMNKSGSIFSREQSTEMGQRSCQLMVALLTGKIGRADYLEGHKHLEALYPGVGFGVAGAKLQKEWQQKGSV